MVIDVNQLSIRMESRKSRPLLSKTLRGMTTQITRVERLARSRKEVVLRVTNSQRAGSSLVTS